MAALMASNIVGEGCCSDQAAALSFILRRFNWFAIDKEKKAHKEDGKKIILRVEERHCVQMFSDYCNVFNARAEETHTDIRDKTYWRLVKYLEGDTNRMNNADLEERKVIHDKRINELKKVTKSKQCFCGPDVPAQMDGGIIIRNLQKKYNAQI